MQEYFKNNKILLIIILILVGIIIILYLNPKNEEVKECPVCDICEDIVEQKVYVDIKGAVKKPGVYEVNEGSIVNDIIKLAGGFTTNAYQKNLNLSKKLSDEMVIYVFTKTEYQKLNSVKVEKVCSSNEIDISNCTESGNSLIIDGNKTVSEAESDSETNSLININTASKSDLMTLPGIGEAKANNIISYRTNNGAFTSISDVKKVSGIGDSIYEQIKNYLTI